MNNNSHSSSMPPRFRPPPRRHDTAIKPTPTLPPYLHHGPPPRLVRFAQDAERVHELTRNARSLFLRLMERAEEKERRKPDTIASREAKILAMDKRRPTAALTMHTPSPPSQQQPFSAILTKHLPPSQYVENNKLLSDLDAILSPVISTITTKNIPRPSLARLDETWNTVLKYNQEFDVRLDLPTYNKVFTLLAARRDGVAALRLFADVENELGQDALPAVYHSAMYALASCLATHQHGLGVYERIKQEGLIPTTRTLNGVMLSCRHIGRGSGDLATAYWDEIVTVGKLQPDAACVSNFLMCFARENRIWRRGVRGLKEEDTSRWRRNPPVLPGTGDEAKDIVAQLKINLGEGTQEDYEIIRNRGQIDEEDDADADVSPIPIHPTNNPQELNISRAQATFAAAEHEGIVDSGVINALIHVHAGALRLNRAWDCLQLFDKHTNCVPNARTFAILMEMYSRAGRVRKCDEVIKVAKEKYGIELKDKDTMGAYAACVGLHRSIDEAVELYRNSDGLFLEKHVRHLRKMDTENRIAPDPNTWRSPQVVGKYLREIQASPTMRFKEQKMRAQMRKTSDGFYFGMEDSPPTRHGHNKNANKTQPWVR